MTLLTMNNITPQWQLEIREQSGVSPLNCKLWTFPCTVIVVPHRRNALQNCTQKSETDTLDFGFQKTPNTRRKVEKISVNNSNCE